jgi:hypothetical protein
LFNEEVNMSLTDPIPPTRSESQISLPTKVLLLLVGGSMMIFAIVFGFLPERNRWVPKVAPDGQVGFVDKSGVWVISPKFDSASDFAEGLALVTMGSGYDAKVGYIDSTGNFAIAPLYDFGQSFEGGKAWVGMGDLRDGWRDTRWGYIDKNGRPVP